MGVGAEFTHTGGDEVGCGAIVFNAADVVHATLIGVAHDVDVFAAEADAGQVVVGTQFVEPAQVVTEQRKFCSLGALTGGDQVYLGRHKGCVCVGSQRIDGFRDDLWGQAADRQQHAALVGTGLLG